MGVWHQTKYLLRKNFQTKKRNKRETLQELLIPIWWILILLVVKLGVKTNEEAAVNESDIPSYGLNSGADGTANTRGNSPYVRSNVTVGVVVQSEVSLVGFEVFDLLKKHSPSSVTYLQFNSTEEMLEYHKKYSKSMNFGVGISFSKATGDDSMGYTLFVREEDLPDIRTKLVGPDKCHDMNTSLNPFSCPANFYISYGVAALQAAIDSAITKVEASLPYYTVPKIELKMMPKTAFTPSLVGFSISVSIYMVMAFTPYVTVLLVNLVQEKEKKLKELMRIMGMTDLAFWLSWALTYAIILLFAVLVMTAIAVPAHILNSNYVIMVIVFYLFGLSIISLSFMLTPFFKNAKSAGLFAGLTPVAFSVLSIPLVTLQVPSAVKWALCLLSPTAFALALSEAVDAESRLTFSNLATKGSFPASNCIVMLIIDILLYLLLAMYFDAVIPAEYGQRRPPHFIFMPSFWKNLFSKKQKGPHRQLSARESDHSNDVEPVPLDMQGSEAVSIHKIKKVFHGKEDVVAVNGVSFDIYEGQVTALLGHNGAGKTTLIAMLTGMTTPTEGTARIYGLDVCDPNQMTRIRKMIGVCPQQNVLFDFLTVREHLRFYAGLKEVPEDTIEEMVNSMLQEIDLSDELDTISKNLSGGQKRKLGVGIALIGDPKVIFLDEPTSGMDPYSRRHMWSMIQQRCKDRVILLTTHFMDEADILADYKVILSKGKLRCAGSSLFLKNRFGIGYHLNMALSDDCDKAKLTQVVQGKIQGAQVIRQHGKEMAFALPLEEISSFSELFTAFEQNNDGSEGCAATRLGVMSYGVSMTTLEEVFLQLEDTMEDSEEEVSDDGSHRELLDTVQVQPVNVEDGRRSTNALHATGVDLNDPELQSNSRKPVWKAKQQLLGLLMIRWLSTIRSPAKIFFMVVLPPILLIAGLVVMLNTKDSLSSAARKSLELSPSLYLSPSSKADYATKALLQNSTGHPITSLLGHLMDYGVGVEQIASVSGYLQDYSGQDPHVLGFDVKTFPKEKNFSGPPQPNLNSAYTMRYNDTMVHSIPVGINVFSSAFHMTALANQGKDPHPIHTNIRAFPSLSPKLTYDASSFTSILLIGMALVVIPGGFAIEVVMHRQLKIRHLLRVSGVSSFVYWLHVFISDALMILMPVLLMFILILAFQLPALNSPAAMGCLVIVVILYLPSVLLFVYVLSFLFSKWDTCQQVMPQVFSFGGFIPFMAVSLVDMINNPDTAIILHYVFLAVDPPYAIFGALYYITRVYNFASLIAQSESVEIPASQYFTWTKHNGIPATFIAPVVHCLILFSLLYFLDMRNSGRVVSCPCAGKGKVSISRSRSSGFGSFRNVKSSDDDVEQEKDKLIATSESTLRATPYAVVVKGLWKKFGSNKDAKVVVRDLHIGVEPGEVFGLLGPNGAGKTTSLSMMTGDVAPTRGQVFVAGYDVNKHPFDALQHLGFCPQVDALWETITLEEHMAAYARIRGVAWGEVKRVVNHYMSALRVKDHAKKRAKDLSGGTKRKVSFSIAMLGDPELLLLDEPSTGMDPSSRRFLWNTISKNVRGDRGAILTTHSMEEADALCSRVGIMVKGQLKCLGSTQHLKSKYGSGYNLEVKLSSSRDSSVSAEDTIARLQEFVVTLFPNAVRTESFGGRMTYKIPKDGTGSLSAIFTSLEQGKQTIGIEEYSFSQSTLEQVFLEFAREQDDDRTGAKDKEIAELRSRQSDADQEPAV